MSSARASDTKSSGKMSLMMAAAGEEMSTRSRKTYGCESKDPGYEDSELKKAVTIDELRQR